MYPGSLQWRLLADRTFGRLDEEERFLDNRKNGSLLIIGRNDQYL